VAGEPLELEQVATLVHLATLEHVDGRARDLSLLVQLAEGPLLGEERRLLRADDHVVEVVAPRRVLREASVEDEGHHRVGVVPERVGEDEEALAAAAELVQRGRQLRIALDEAREVLAQLALQRSVAVHLVDALAHVVVELVIVDLLAPGFHSVSIQAKRGSDSRIFSFF